MNVGTHLLTLAALSAVTATSLPAMAQLPCARCGLKVEPVVELKSHDVPIVPSRVVSVLRLSNGNFVVSHLFQEPALVLYSPDGDVLKIHQKLGAGPGEFKNAPRLHSGPGDTIHAFEPGRIVKLTRALDHVKTSRSDLAVREGAVILRDGRIVVDARVMAGSNQQHRQNILNRDGSLAASLDPGPSVERPYFTVIAPANRGGWWSMEPNGSRLTLWSMNGSPMRQVSVERKWFKAWAGRLPGEPFSSRPRPHVMDISEIANDRLLIYTTVADSKWAAADDPQRSRTINIAEYDFTRTYDGVLELIDSRTGAVLGSYVSPDPLRLVDGSTNLFSSTTADENGHVTIHIWRVSIL